MLGMEGLGHSNLISCCSGPTDSISCTLHLKMKIYFWKYYDVILDHVRLPRLYYDFSVCLAKHNCEKGEYCSWTNHNVQMTTITKSKSAFLSRPTYPVLLLIFYLQQEIKLEWFVVPNDHHQ